MTNHVCRCCGAPATTSRRILVRTWPTKVNGDWYIRNKVKKGRKVLWYCDTCANCPLPHWDAGIGWKLWLVAQNIMVRYWRLCGKLP